MLVCVCVSCVLWCDMASLPPSPAASVDCKSPRHLFARFCRSAGIMVEPFIMRKAADNPALNLAHMSLGNKKISALAMCLPSLPLLYGLDLTGKYVP